MAALKRILLVEDDDSLASVYVNRLQAEGFDVRRVANGEEALASALTYKPDLVVLDVMMPKVSGFDVLDILRNTPETAKLTKRKAELEKLILGSRNKLGNEAFVAKAPPAIIQGLRDQLHKLEEELGAIEKNLKELGG